MTDCSEKLCFCMFPYGNYFIRIGKLHFSYGKYDCACTETYGDTIFSARKIWFSYGKTHVFRTEKMIFSVRKKWFFPYGKITFSVRNNPFFRTEKSRSELFFKIAITRLILRLTISTRNLYLSVLINWFTHNKKWYDISIKILSRCGQKVKK